MSIFFLKFIIVLINWQQDFVSSNQNEITLMINQAPPLRLSYFVNHWYDYRSSWTPLSCITFIINGNKTEWGSIQSVIIQVINKVR